MERIPEYVPGPYSQLHAICKFQIVHMFGKPNHEHELQHLHAIRDNTYFVPHTECIFYFIFSMSATKYNVTASKMLFAQRQMF